LNSLYGADHRYAALAIKPPHGIQQVRRLIPTPYAAPLRHWVSQASARKLQICR
jgi:hypothetical protein